MSLCLVGVRMTAFSLGELVRKLPVLEVACGLLSCASCVEANIVALESPGAHVKLHTPGCPLPRALIWNVYGRVSGCGKYWAQALRWKVALCNFMSLRRRKSSLWLGTEGADDIRRDTECCSSPQCPGCERSGLGARQAKGSSFLQGLLGANPCVTRWE